jgi:ABC-type transport system involved in multi-copper enzyme maturation permease subunit
MTETIDADPAGRPPQGDLDGPGTWHLTWTGVRAVARLELRQRVRSSRWKLVLLVWALVLGALTAMLRFALHSTGDADAGAVLFGLIVYLVLSLGSLIAPGLSATSVNGDRAAGVLATLQTTLLTPAEIVIGKLAAAWLTSLAFLIVALPFVTWGYVEGGTPAGRLVVTLTLLAVMLLVVCAVGLGWSSLTARTASSVVLTYLTAAFVGVGLPILFGLTIPMVTESGSTWTWYRLEPVDARPSLRCVAYTDDREQIHTEWTWWLLAASPYVILADAWPRPTGTGTGGGDDVLSAIRSGVRTIRLGDGSDCTEPGRVFADWDAARAAQREREDALGASWPYGLALNLALGAGFTVLSVRRLRAPARTLPRGTRVA